MAQPLPPLADVVLVARDGSYAPNARRAGPKPGRRPSDLPVTPLPARGRALASLVEVVAVRPRGWSEKKRPPPWTPTLARELTWGLRDDDVEKFVVFLLDDAERLIGIYEHTIGSERETAVYPYHVLKMALLVGASFVVLCHNHPGGESEPSTQDYRTTTRLRDVLALYGVLLTEHVVVGAHSGLHVMDMRAGGMALEARADWHLPPPEGVATVRAETGELVAPQRSTRASFEPYGKESVWLVKSGLVRPQQGSPEHAASLATLGTPESAARVVRAIAGVALTEGGRQGFLILAVSSTWHLLGAEQVAPEVLGDELVRPATLLALMTGAHAVIVVGIVKVPSVMQRVVQGFRQVQDPLVQLADVLLIEGEAFTSARSTGVLA
jgi:hypothetical protein